MTHKISQICVIFSILICLLLTKGYADPLVLKPEYVSLIQQKIISSFIYPQEAQTKGWEGIAKVKFTLVRDGRIKKIDLAESSGYPLLDAAAIVAIKDASPYPFPKDYTKNELEITLPLNYTQAKPAKPAKPAQDTQVSVQAPQDKKELTYFIDLAIRNNEPLKVAQEETESAQLKVTETQRNLFPALKLQSYTTEGKIYTAEFAEKEVRVQLDQPLYYEGRLGDTINQAKANLEITKKNYDRLKFDVLQKTETAYYKLAFTKMHLIQKEALKQEAGEMLDTIEKLSSLGMAIPLEVSGARAWFEQIGFQMESIKQDLSMAELTLKQALNIKETPKLEAQLPEVPEVKELNLDLEACLEVAFQHRPEMYISESLIKFNDYGQKIEANKNNAFTVDLTSFYGRYQGHYRAVPWQSANNWYVGLKVTRPWGGNTFNTSYSKEKVQPRLGQSSSNESSTLSAEFNLLDNIKGLSDKKRSDIDLHRSLSDLDETLKIITAEVQDAFLNYRKAILQLKTAQSEMKFRRNDAEVTKIRALVGEGSLSNAVASLYEVSGAQTKYIEALANYQISLVNLKKACGYGLKI